MEKAVQQISKSSLEIAIKSLKDIHNDLEENPNKLASISGPNWIEIVKLVIELLRVIKDLIEAFKG